MPNLITFICNKIQFCLKLSLRFSTSRNYIGSWWVEKISIDSSTNCWESFASGLVYHELPCSFLGGYFPVYLICANCWESFSPGLVYKFSYSTFHFISFVLTYCWNNFTSELVYIVIAFFLTWYLHFILFLLLFTWSLLLPLQKVLYNWKRFSFSFFF